MGNIDAGIRNIVEIANIQSGEEVVILIDPDTDPVVFKALSKKCDESGGEVVVIESPETAYGGLREPLNTLAQAVRSSNVVINLKSDLIVATLAGLRAIYDYGAKWVEALIPTAEMFASSAARFPPEIFFLVGKLLQQSLRKGGQIQVTDPRGSNFTLESISGNIGGYMGYKLLEPGPGFAGYLGLFPVGATVFWPEDTVNGVMYPSAFNRIGEFDEPVRMEIEKGWVTDISGGATAGELESLLDSHENARCFAEAGFGLNPKAPVNGLHGGKNLFALMLQRHAGSFLVGLGNTFPLGGNIYSPLHLDGVISNPTIYLDDECLVKEGKLMVLERDDVRAAAGKYGEPDEVLSSLEHTVR